MGFRYRKSINLGGGFRVNISKSGIGYSWDEPFPQKRTQNRRKKLNKNTEIG